MEIHDVRYIGSFPSEAKCPRDNRNEYAFIGRSNVGKSSLINMLTGRKEIARVSKQPGKTQSLNYYLVDETWYLVDLPGYGYAKVSKKKRMEWKRMIDHYMSKRPNLMCAFVLLDGNIPLQDIDLEFINWLGQEGIPFVIVYTKTDRIKPAEVEDRIDIIRNRLLEYWEDLPQQFVTASRTGFGREEILTFIDAINQEVEELH